MGHDITAISNHTLDITNIESLAIDLSKRLNVNIEYGYYPNEELCTLLNRNFENKFIVIDRVIKDSSLAIYRLRDERYQQKLAFVLHGKAVFYNPLYWGYHNGSIPSEGRIAHEIMSFHFYNYDLCIDQNNESGSLFIYNELFVNNDAYICRWWAFCDIFRKDYGHEENLGKKHIYDYREKLKFWMEKLGGNKTYLVDDQSDVLRGIGLCSDESEMTWQQFETYVADKAADLLVDVPKYFSNKNYCETVSNREAYPLAFVDDFSDLYI